MIANDGKTLCIGSLMRFTAGGPITPGRNMLELNKIHCGDCLELMPSVPDKTIDLILCDLPYGATHAAWDNLIPFQPLWAEYRRIIKDNAAIVLTAQQPFATDLINSARDIFRYDLVWEKTVSGVFLNVNKMPLRWSTSC